MSPTEFTSTVAGLRVLTSSRRHEGLEDFTIVTGMSAGRARADADSNRADRPLRLIILPDTVRL